MGCLTRRFRIPLELAVERAIWAGAIICLIASVALWGWYYKHRYCIEAILHVAEKVTFFNARDDPEWAWIDTYSGDMRLRAVYGYIMGLCWSRAALSAVIAILTRSKSKRNLARRFSVHSIIGFALSTALLLNTQYVFRGPEGHRVNILVFALWVMSGYEIHAFFVGLAKASYEDRFNSQGVTAAVPAKGSAFVSLTAGIPWRLLAIRWLCDAMSIASRFLAHWNLAVCVLSVVGLSLSMYVWASYYRILKPCFAAIWRTNRSDFFVMGTFFWLDCVISLFTELVGYIYCVNDSSHLMLMWDGVRFEGYFALTMFLRLISTLARLVSVILQNDEAALVKQQDEREKLLEQQRQKEERETLQRYVYHELRVPLNSIVLGLEMMLGGDSEGRLALSGSKNTVSEPGDGQGTLYYAREKETASQGAVAPMLTAQMMLKAASHSSSSASSSRADYSDGGAPGVGQGGGGMESPKLIGVNVTDLMLMKSASDTMLRILSDLLDYGRIEAGSFSMSLAPVRLRDILQTALTQMEPFAQGNNVRLQLELGALAASSASSSSISSSSYDAVAACSQALDELILADATRLGQVLANYVSNAVKFSPHDGRGSVVVLVKARRFRLADVALTGYPRTPTKAIAGSDTGAGAASNSSGSSTGSVASGPGSAGGGAHPRGRSTAMTSSLARLRFMSVNEHHHHHHHRDVGVAQKDPSVRGRPRSLSPDSLAASIIGDKDTRTRALEAATARGLQLSGDALELVIAVKDNGCGISAKELPLVFSPYKQLASGHLYKGRGTGLGLAIARSIGQGHGGRVGVTSVEGLGSEFTLTVPVAVLAPKQQQPQLADEEDTTQRRLSVLSQSAESVSSLVAVAGEKAGPITDGSPPTQTPLLRPAAASVASSSGTGFTGGGGGGEPGPDVTQLLIRGSESTRATGVDGDARGTRDSATTSASDGDTSQSDGGTSSSSSSRISIHVSVGDVAVVVADETARRDSSSAPPPPRHQPATAVSDNRRLPLPSVTSLSDARSSSSPAGSAPGSSASLSPGHASSINRSSRNRNNNNSIELGDASPIAAALKGAESSSTVGLRIHAPSGDNNNRKPVAADGGSRGASAVLAIGRSHSGDDSGPLLPASPPAHLPPPPSATPPPVSASTDAGPRIRLLIVDDVLSNRRFLLKLLQRRLPASSLFQEAADGLSAVEAVRGAMATGGGGGTSAGSGSDGGDAGFDVVTLDFEMPVMNGYDAATAMRAAGFKGLIVGVTGNALKADIETFIAAGADAVVSKPVSVDTLVKLINDFYRARAA